MLLSTSEPGPCAPEYAKPSVVAVVQPSAWHHPGKGDVGIFENQPLDHNIEVGFFAHLALDASFFGFAWLDPAAGHNPVAMAVGMISMLDQRM